MKKLILYAASDRYNYGDLIMPILFHKFLIKYAQDLLAEYEVIYSSVTDSDLGIVGSEPTVSLGKIQHDLPDGSVILLAGGAVLGADLESQFFFNLKTQKEYDLYNQMRKTDYNRFRSIVDHRFNVGWSHPYTPGKAQFQSDVRIIYNSVGGRMRQGALSIANECYERLKTADYISVRDSCVEAGLKNNGINNVILSPDSAAIINDLIDDEFLNKKVSKSTIKKLPDRYFIFQAAKHKITKNTDAIAAKLLNLKERTNMEIVLLPVGYAVGHDDQIILKEISSKLGKNAILMDGLNIWEIIYTVKNCSALLGTSLHAIITAICYAKPHFAISNQVPKLMNFLETWSFSPYHKIYTLDDMNKLAEVINSEDDINDLLILSEKLKNLVIENNNRIIDVIKNC